MNENRGRLVSALADLKSAEIALRCAAVSMHEFCDSGKWPIFIGLRSEIDNLACAVGHLSNRAEPQVLGKRGRRVKAQVVHETAVRLAA